MIYWEVLREVLLFGADNWVFLVAMAKNIEDVHMAFLHQIKVNTLRENWDGIWRRVVLESILKELSTQKLGTYIDKQQTTVADWVLLRPIYEVCGREAG